MGSPTKPNKRTGSTEKVIDKGEVKKANYNKLKAMVIWCCFLGLLYIYLLINTF